MIIWRGTSKKIEWILRKLLIFIRANYFISEAKFIQYVIILKLVNTKQY